MLHLRIRKALSGIENYAFLGADGAHYRTLITDALASASWSRLRDIDQALSLGARDDLPTNGFGRPVPTPASRANTDKRQAIRACLLAELAIKDRPVASLPIERLERLEVYALRAAFKTSFPLIATRGVADAWETMTEPAQHNPAQFRYIVHALRIAQTQNPGATATWTSADTILASPNATLQSWLAISCSVIDQAHPLTFHPGGLILKVPATNILTTNHADQSFSNHAGAISAPNSSVPRHELAGHFIDEIRSKDIQYRGLKSPAEILARTNGGTSRYNEVVVRGTDTTKRFQVMTVGLFVQRDAGPVITKTINDAAVKLKLEVITL